MKKTILLTVLLFTLVIGSSLLVEAGTVDLSSPITGFGFQNGNYIYFRDPISVSVEQIASSNSTYGNWVFVQQVGSNEIFGFYASGVDVTVNSFFVNDVLELNCAGSGSVQVQVCARAKPNSISTFTGNWDATNKVATVAVTSSGVTQLSWATVQPTVGPQTGGDPNPTASTVPIHTISPTQAENFGVNDIELGTIQPNSTVTATLYFSYKNSPIALQSITFSSPFNSWYRHDSAFSTVPYILNYAGVNNASVTLTFQIPADVAVEVFRGTFTVSAVDAFGVQMSSSANIHAAVAGAQVENSWWQFFRERPVYIIVGVLVIIALVAITLAASKRRR